MTPEVPMGAAPPEPETSASLAPSTSAAPGPSGARAAASGWARGLYTLALLAASAPLWVSVDVPLVDLPQHLHLIAVLHGLDNPATLSPELYAARQTLTPYLGYYYPVHLLSWVLPLEVANRLFLSATVMGLALSLAFLLHAFERPIWPSLLALPLAYGDSFGWGFINFVAALPFTFLALGLFVRTLMAPASRQRRRAAVAMGICLPLVLLLHVQAFGFLAFALPWLLVTLPVPATPRLRGWLSARRTALLSVVPGVALFFVWLLLRLQDAGDTVAPGRPWKAWGPTFSPENLRFESAARALTSLPGRMMGLLRDGSDGRLLWGLLVVVGLAVVAGRLPAFRRAPAPAPAPERAVRLRWTIARAGLPVLGLGLYFLTPFDIHGLVYYLSPRFVHLAGPLLIVALIPDLNLRGQRLGLLLSAALVLALGGVLSRGFLAFDREAGPIRELAPLAGPHPLVMGLIYDAGSEIMRLPVHLHAAATVARLNGGAPNFSFAQTPHSPLRYRQAPPPSFPSEWRPQQFRFHRHGAAYDAFLMRGGSPERTFRRELGRRVEVVGQRDALWLLRRR